MVKLKLVSLALLCAASGAQASAPAYLPLLGPNGAAAFELVTTPESRFEQVLAFRPDGVTTVAGSPAGYFATRATYTNYALHAEWRWPGKPGNGGVLLHIQGGPKDKVWPLSQQVQTKIHFAGDLLPMAGAGFDEALTSAPGAYPAIKGRVAADSERPAGEWNTMDVVCKDGTIEVRINGVTQNRVTHAQPASGRIGFQLEGAPYELRDVRLQLLD